MSEDLQKKTLRRGFFKTLLAGAAGAALFTPSIFGDNKPKVITKPSDITGAEPYVGEICLFAFNFAPNGWFQCNGQLLPIQNYTALFSLIGTYYGGNGVNNFALPDLRGRVPLSQGQGPGLSLHTIGETGGEENHTLIVSEIPSHNHLVSVYNGNGNSNSPGNNFLANNSEGIMNYASSSNSTMNSAALANTGGNQSHNNMQPYLVLNYCIAYQGIFPSRP